MLSFATEFPVDPTRKTSAFLDAVKFWLLHSPHTEFVREDFENAPTSGPWTIIRQGEQLDALFFADESESSAAIKHTKPDGEINWETTAVFSATETDAWVSIRTSRESTHPATTLPLAKKPILVRTLLDKLGGGTDGHLVVSGASRRLTNSEVGLAASLILGDSSCHLPVVYVSAGFNGKHAIDANSLANDLAGMAHVVSEPNRPFSQRLQIDVSSDNVYGGAIGIYWPNGQGRRSSFLERDYNGKGSLKRAIVEEVRTALLNRRPTFRCTWSSVEQDTSRSAYNALKESGSKEIDQYIDAFDTEMKAKEQLIRDAENEISRLQAEVRKLESRPASSKGIVLQVGKEQDFYAGEITQIVLDAVEEAQQRASSDSRRAHILASITSDMAPIAATRTHREELKDVLRTYRTMDAKTRKALENMGFSITDDGKHYKLIFQEDDRYMFILAKTGSDHRGGLNAASDIAKRLF
ncbi:hypothetical protein [Tardiphaga sp. 768_D3_N2_1]|uniref:hypothetical protein n=1 Tax=Tardiphaga sp. 768_D3_N2_1 TaxID=3240783 RepID=UPI003F8AF347